MNTADTSNPPDTTTQPTFGDRLSSLWSRLLAIHYALPAITVVLGFLIGVGLMAAVMPKPVDPATYTKPLLAQQQQLQAQQKLLGQQQAYARVIAIDYPLDVLDYNLMSNDCNNGSISLCATDASRVGSNALKFQADLKTLKVPSCLSKANGLFLSALQDEATGGAGLSAGLKNNDDAKVSAASTALKNGFDGITNAMTAYKSASC